MNPAPNPAENSAAEKEKARALGLSNQRYVSSVKPIFQEACLDCHSDQTRFPWYYELPWVKGLIDKDISEAKKHIDMTGDFPFRGHGSPEEDLKAIEKVVREKEMPPFRYRVMHPASGINQVQREAVFRWIRDTQQELQKVARSQQERKGKN
ncbi:MAG: heme-binding domain-containing protein [Pseudomonadota bacterium]